MGTEQSSLKARIFEIVLDKLVIAGLLAFAGFVLTKKLDEYEHERKETLAKLSSSLDSIRDEKKGKIDRENALVLGQNNYELDLSRLQFEIKQKTIGNEISYVEKQLNDFYYPLYFCINKDTETYHLVYKKLPKPLQEQIRHGILVPNHRNAVKVIEEKMYLADTEDELLNSMISQYVKHVAVLESLEKIGSEQWPYQVDDHAGFPGDYGVFRDALFKKIQQLKDKHTGLVKQLNQR